jgi:two-component system, HptB-dependent secretion and biofilm response regulator
MTLLQEIRTTHDQNSVMVIAFSGDEDPHIRALFMRIGANDYIQKPYHHEEFFSRLYNMVEHISVVRDVHRLNSELHEINKYRQEEEEKAHRKQLQMIQNDLESSNSFSTKLFFKPADILSGDSYSIHQQKDSSILLYIIDGMGHGVVPSLTTFAVAGRIREYISNHDNFDGLMQYLVNSLHGILDDAEQLSYSFVNIDLEEKEIKYAIGGMYPAIIMHDNEVVRYKANNIPMMNFTQSINVDTISFESFEKILLYSDGLVEEDGISSELFEPKKLIKDEILLDGMIDIFSKHKNEDDVTIIYLKNRESDKSS